MNATHAFTFLWTPASLVVSSFAVLVTAGLCFIAWRRSGYRPSLGGLELLRMSIVTIAALLFNQPEWVEEYRPKEKPAVAVFWDGSASMGTRDVTTAPSPSSSSMTRGEAIGQLTAGSTWDRLRDRREVVVAPFSTPQPGRGSDLSGPLEEALEKFRNLLGVVLISDGDWNEGQSPAQAASRLRSKGVPVFTVPVGSPDRLPDVELLSLDAPTFGVAGKSVRIPFSIESSLPREYATTVSLKTSDGDEVTREVRVAPLGRTTESLVWLPKTTGDFTLSLEVPKHVEETIADNNRLTAPISIREAKLKVLVVESYPRWEYRYLRNALSRDPGVELSCLLFHPGLSKGGGGNKDYLKQFPSGKDELSKYDVVFLGDVGLDDGQLTAEECRLLRGLVEHQASGLVLMPGWQGRQFSLLDTELGDLVPVLLDAGQPGGWGSRTPGRFELTESGRRSLLTKLADTQDDNLAVWEDLPGFQWYAPLLRAKAGTEVLAVHKDMSNEHGRLPLLVTRTFGTGKVLFMGTDGAWRWRRGVEDKYHYRFWGQVVRWMAYQRNMAKGETMRLYFSERGAAGGRRRDRPRGGPFRPDRDPPLLPRRRRMGNVPGAVHRRRGRPARGGAGLHADGSDARDFVLRQGSRRRTDRPAGASGGDGRDRAHHARKGDRPERRRRPGSIAGGSPGSAALLAASAIVEPSAGGGRVRPSPGGVLGGS